MTPTKPFTKRERQRLVQYKVGHRMTNAWGSGDLPAPFAEGDVVLLTAEALSAAPIEFRERMSGYGDPYDVEPGHYVVTYGPSVDEGDGWYFRVENGTDRGRSGRLHVAYDGRVAGGWIDPLPDFMAPFELVETADPEGLAKRERMLAAGWSLVEQDCHACHGTGKVTKSPGWGES